MNISNLSSNFAASTQGRIFMKSKYENFLEMAKLLNNKFNIQPLLYGSLGLEVRTGANLNADDIDIMIPQLFLLDKWPELVDYLESCGYKMTDLHEHTFEKDGLQFNFSFVESLLSFADIKEEDLEIKHEKQCFFKLMNLQQYLAVYQASFSCPYRKRIGKAEKDKKKLEIIKQALHSQKS